jgi:predicted DNA-binding transcriptional regulator AlpA
MSNPRPKRYLTSAQLRERYGDRSTMWIGRIMKRDPKFPRPIYIGRFRFWDLADIEAYERVAACRVPKTAVMSSRLSRSSAAPNADTCCASET